MQLDWNKIKPQEKTKKPTQKVDNVFFIKAKNLPAEIIVLEDEGLEEYEEYYDQKLRCFRSPEDGEPGKKMYAFKGLVKTEDAKTVVKWVPKIIVCGMQVAVEIQKQVIYSQGLKHTKTPVLKVCFTGTGRETQYYVTSDKHVEKAGLEKFKDELSELDLKAFVDNIFA